MNFTTLVRDPLVHFLVFGLLLFLIVEFLTDTDRPDPDSSMILITQERQDQLIAQFTNAWQRQPSEAETRSLIDTFILEEVYYREALALGLDKNDPLIRRRLQQKLEYLQEDLSSFEVPEDEQLIAWYQQHQARFASPRRYTFQQVLVKPEDEGSISELLQSLNSGAAAPAKLTASGLLETNNTALSSQMIMNRFGESFVNQISTLSPAENWQGPITSTFGTHLVLLNKVIEPELPALSDIKEQVLQQYVTERREQAKITRQKQLRNSYAIKIE